MQPYIMTDTKIRCLGGILIILGLLFAYFGVYLPLEAAKNHIPKLSLSYKLTFLVPFAVIIGSYTAIFGRKGCEWMGTKKNGKQKLKLAGWILAGICLVAGIALHEWLKMTISSYGYQ